MKIARFVINLGIISASSIAFARDVSGGILPEALKHLRAVALSGNQGDLDRDFLVSRAKLAEQAERYDEMATDMKEVASQSQELSVEERNLLSLLHTRMQLAPDVHRGVLFPASNRGRQRRATIRPSSLITRPRLRLN